MKLFVIVESETPLTALFVIVDFEYFALVMIFFDHFNLFDNLFNCVFTHLKWYYFTVRLFELVAF